MEGAFSVRWTRSPLLYQLSSRPRGVASVNGLRVQPASPAPIASRRKSPPFKVVARGSNPARGMTLGVTPSNTWSGRAWRGLARRQACAPAQFLG